MQQYCYCPHLIGQDTETKRNEVTFLWYRRNNVVELGLKHKTVSKLIILSAMHPGSRDYIYLELLELKFSGIYLQKQVLELCTTFNVSWFNIQNLKCLCSVLDKHLPHYFCNLISDKGANNFTRKPMTFLGQKIYFITRVSLKPNRSS